MIPESLLAQVKQGNRSAMDSAIELCLVRAKQIANAWGRKRPNQYEDIRSAASLGVVKAINSIAEGRLQTCEVKAYIDQSIREHIRDFIRNDHLIYIPKGVFKGLKETEQLVPIVYRMDYNEDDEENPEAHDVLSFDIPVDHDTEAAVIEEFYTKLCNLEMIILHLREEGKTLEEIAKDTGELFSMPWIYKMLGRIKDKFIQERIKHGREDVAGQTD